jgi:hypothetical protein
MAERPYGTAPSDLAALEPFWPSRRLLAFDEMCCTR